MRLIVTAPGRQPLVPTTALVEAAKNRYGDITVHRGPSGLEVDSYLYVTLPRERLTVTTFVDGASVSFESGDADVADAVAWYRSLLPPDFPRIIAFDAGWSGHVDLKPGVTAEEIPAHWVDHGSPGWERGDPDFG